MVVVYSGDSDRPPPNWEVDQPSERATIAHFEPVVPVSPPLPSREPFPLAQDLPFVPPASTFAAPDERSHTARRAPDARRVSDARRQAPERASTAPLPSAHAATGPAPARRSLPIQAAALVALGMLGLGGATFMLTRSSDEAVAPPLAAAPVASAVVARAALPRRVEAVIALPVASAVQSASLPKPAPASLSPATTDSSKFTRVELEVFPTDAKVVRRGARHPGPPYVFNVPKDKTISIEITKPGYVTRKLVLDGAERSVMVGLFRKGLRRRAEPNSRAPVRERVQSGL